MPDESEKHVRFYFSVSVSCLIPRNPHGKRDGVPDKKWEEGWLRGVTNDLEAKLSKGGFDVAYRQHVPIDGALRLYEADFVVSALHEFPAAQVFTPRPGYTGFSVRKKYFSQAKAFLEDKLVDLLKQDYVVNITNFEYAASRSFVFEAYFEGMLELRCVISSNAIENAGGHVREAIENFNNEIVGLFEAACCQVDPQTTFRRPHDNIYKFKLSATKYYGFTENEVVGELVLMQKNTPVDKLIGLGIHCASATETGSDEKNNIQMHCLDCLPSEIDLIAFTFDFVGYDKDVNEYYDELI